MPVLATIVSRLIKAILTLLAVVLFGLGWAQIEVARLPTASLGSTPALTDRDFGGGSWNRYARRSPSGCSPRPGESSLPRQGAFRCRGR